MKKNEEIGVTPKGFVSVGKVRDSHGLKGELFVVTNLEKAPPWMSQFTEFTLEFKSPSIEGKHESQYKNFSVKKTRAHKKGFIVKSDEISDRNESDVYKGAVFYIKESYLETKPGEEVYLREIEGFEVLDNGKSIGTVSGFSSNTAQDLLLVALNGKTSEIPFVQAFISKIDWDNKKIEMNLPEGLIEESDEEKN